MKEKKAIIRDRRNIGTIIGIILGISIAFAVTGKDISIAAIVIGFVAGAIVGRFIGYFIKRKLANVKFKTRNVLYDFYTSYISAVAKYSRNLGLDINSTRIILESVGSLSSVR